MPHDRWMFVANYFANLRIVYQVPLFSSVFKRFSSTSDIPPDILLNMCVLVIMLWQANFGTSILMDEYPLSDFVVSLNNFSY